MRERERSYFFSLHNYINNVPNQKKTIMSKMSKMKNIPAVYWYAFALICIGIAMYMYKQQAEAKKEFFIRKKAKSSYRKIK